PRQVYLIIGVCARVFGQFLAEGEGLEVVLPCRRQLAALAQQVGQVVVNLGQRPSIAFVLRKLLDEFVVQVERQSVLFFRRRGLFALTQRGGQVEVVSGLIVQGFALFLIGEVLGQLAEDVAR